LLRGKEDKEEDENKEDGQASPGKGMNLGDTEEIRFSLKV
jgi:hypothetical protein